MTGHLRVKVQTQFLGHMQISPGKSLAQIQSVKPHHESPNRDLGCDGSKGANLLQRTAVMLAVTKPFFKVPSFKM